MISYNVPINAQRMTIGVQGENNVREFLFDVTEWRQLTGNIGTAEMVVQRNGDSSPYATVITMKDENTVSWVPTSTDTAKAGAGKIELMWIKNDQTVKTKIFVMKVDPSLPYAVPDDSLDPWQSWMPDIINADARIKSNTNEIQALKTQLANPFSFKGKVSDIDALPTEGNAVNDTYYVESETCLYAWNGTEWGDASMSESEYLQALQEIKSEVADTQEATRNLWPWDTTIEISDSGYVHKYFDPPLPAGTYTLSAMVFTTASSVPHALIANDVWSNVLANPEYTDSAYVHQSFTLTEAADRIRLLSGSNTTTSAGYTAKWNDIQLEIGSQSTPFIETKSGKDESLREAFGYNDSLPIEIGANDWTVRDGYVYFYFDEPLAPGRYTLLYQVSTDDTTSDVSNCRFLAGHIYNTAQSTSPTQTLYRNRKYAKIVTISDTTRCVYLWAGTSASSSAGASLEIGFFKLVKDEFWDTAQEFIYSQFIANKLAFDRTCIVPPGTYVCDKFQMPDETFLQGCGDASKLVFADGLDGSMITMGNRCTVDNLTLFGADEDIVLPDSEFVPVVDQTDLLDGASEYFLDGSVVYRPVSQIPAGTYQFSITADSDKASDENIYIRVCSTSAYSTNAVISSASIPKGTASTRTISFEKPALSVWVFAGSTVAGSSGYTVAIEATPEMHSETTIIGTRHGITWEKTNDEQVMKHGIISNCRISRFTGSGIRARDTGQPVDNNLAVTNSFVKNCGVGLYVQRDSEFLKISNNTFAWNYYGILDRGGNMYVENCGIDRNVIGLQVDDDEGTNGGHGKVSGCSFGHTDNNTGYGLIIRGTGRELISNCNFYYSKIRLQNTDGNVITSCGFGRSSGIDIIGGKCSIIANCMMLSAGQTPITVTDNTTVKLYDCYTRSGQPVSLP